MIEPSSQDKKRQGTTRQNKVSKGKDKKIKDEMRREEGIICGKARQGKVR